MTSTTLNLKGRSLRGPRQLLEQLPTADVLPTLTLLGLDEFRNVDSECSYEVDLDLRTDLPDWPNLRKVAVLQVSSETPLAAAREYMQKLDLPLSQTLDLLVLQDRRWWSAICTDESCCPAAGRQLPAVNAIEMRRELLLSWSKAISSSDSQPSASLLDALRDLKIRDSVLIELLDKSRRERILELLSRLVSDHPTAHAESLAAAHSIKAASAYLTKDLETAASECDCAQQLVPEYSLARLLKQGLAAGAPADLLATAFADTARELVGCD